MRQKMVAGFATGDRVHADVPVPYAALGAHVGRVTVRKNAFFAIQTEEKKVDSVPARFCRLIQRADGYDYTFISDVQGNESTPPLPSKKERLLPPQAFAQGYPQAEES